MGTMVILGVANKYDNWDNDGKFTACFQLLPVSPEHIFKQTKHHPLVGALELDKDEDQDLYLIVKL